MDLLEIYKFLTSPEFGGIARPVSVLLVLALTVLQVSKIPINPWSWLARRVGKALNAELFEKIEKLNERLDEERKERQQDKVSDMRWFLLSFAQECRKGIDHDKEQWTYVLNKCAEYESYCLKNDIQNGVIEEDTKYIRELYNMLSREHKI